MSMDRLLGESFPRHRLLSEEVLWQWSLPQLSSLQVFFFSLSIVLQAFGKGFEELRLGVLDLSLVVEWREISSHILNDNV